MAIAGEVRFMLHDERLPFLLWDEVCNAIVCL